MSEKFAFLQSVRFWNLVIVSVILVLRQNGVLVEEALVSNILEVVALVLGGSVVIRTTDRFAEKSGGVDTA